MRVKRFAMAGLVVIALSTAACGGGGGGGATPSAPGVSATSTPVAGAGGTSLSSSGAAVAASNVSGITSSLTVAGSGSVSATETSNAPVGLPIISATARSASTQFVRTTASGGNAALVYVAITATTATTISGFPAATFTFAAAPAGSIYLAYYTGTAWATVGSAGTVSGDTVTFGASTFTPAIALAANASLFIAVYTGSVLAGSATPSPSPAATASASASPSPVVSGTPFPTGTSNPNLSNVASTFFSTIVPNGNTIVLSAWDLSGNITSALVQAATNGHSVTVITPYSEYSSNSSDVNQIVSAGGHAIYEYTSSPGSPQTGVTYQQSPMDIHAKFAIIDGVAYMDGHNWFTTDVILKDTDATDIAAIQSDLTSFPTPATNGETSEDFTTDKQVSLQMESTFLQNVARPAIDDGAADEFDFITESFNPSHDTGDYNDDVYIGMCQIASSPRQPALRMVFEQESGYSSAAQTAVQNLLLLDPGSAGKIRSNNNGHEKMSMIRKGGVPLAAWFGSSNSTSTDLFDWGMVIEDPALLTALASYFDTTEYANATAIAGGSGSPVACGTLHS